MAEITLADIEGDVNTAVEDAQKLLAVVESLDHLYPASEPYVVKAQNVLTVLESVLAKLNA